MAIYKVLFEKLNTILILLTICLFFEAAHGPPPWNISFIFCNEDNWHSCTLLKKDPKNT